MSVITGTTAAATGTTTAATVITTAATTAAAHACQPRFVAQAGGRGWEAVYTAP
jgi:hypothetical protein